MSAATRVIRIDVGSPMPVYRQISDSIRALLVAGALLPGEFLPPVRELAIDLAVHFNTVAEAYRSLAQEGWLDLRRRRGARVLDRATPPQPPEQTTLRLSQRLQEMVAAARADGVPLQVIARQLRTIAEELEPCTSPS